MSGLGQILAHQGLHIGIAPRLPSMPDVSLRASAKRAKANQFSAAWCLEFRISDLGFRV